MMSFIRRKIGGKAVKARLSGNARAALFSFLAVLMFVGSVPSAFATLGEADATYNQGGAHPKLARVSTLGAFEAGYPAGSGFNGTVRVIVRQADGKSVVGGDFTSFNGTSRNHIARLNANGTLDNTFDPGTGFTGSVYSLALDGTDIYAGGDFASYNGTTRSRIARLNTDGTLDTGFDPGTGITNVGGTYTGEVYSILLAGTDIYAAGYFTGYAGTTVQNIVRINTDGSIDNGFNIGTAFASSSAIFAAVLDGTDVIVAGTFAAVGATERHAIARLNNDGTLDLAFDSTTGFRSGGGSEGYVYALAMDGTDVYAGGSFSAYNGTSRNNIARVNNDGTVDAGFTPSLSGGDVWALAMDGTDVVVGGVFTTVSATNRHGIVRLNTDGTLDAGFNVGGGVDSFVYALAMDGTDVVIGGSFVTDLNTGFNDTVRTVVAQADGKVIVGGDFTAVNGTARNRIARLNADGTLDGTFDPGTGFNGSVYAVILDGTDVYVGGSFTSFNGTARNRIARLNTDGTIDAGFDPGTGLNNTANALVMSGTDVYAAGQFTTFNGTSSNRIVRVNSDGSIDAGFNPGTGFDSIVRAITMIDTDVYAGGDFTTYNGATNNRIIRLNSDGSADTGFASGTGFGATSVYALAMDGSDVLVGGDFVSYASSARLRIVRLNPTGSVDTAFSSSSSAFDSTVMTLALNGTNVVAGGTFSTFKNVGYVRFAKIDSTDPAGFTIAQTGGTTSVGEAGTTDTFTVVLDEKPASDVVVTVVSSDTGEATVAPASLTFTSSNWYTPQTVTVTGVDDAIVDGTQTSNITLSINDAASSNEYDPVADQIVSAEVTDNDAGGGGGGGNNSITMTSPNGGESWTAAQQKQITWQYGGSANHTVVLSLSTDGGATYAQIATVGQLDPGLYVWTVPDINTTTARIKVDFIQNNSVAASDASNANFTIVGTVATPPAGGGGGGNNVTPPVQAPTTVFTASSSINEDLGIVPSVNPINCVSGSLIRTATQNAVYYCGANGKRYVFPNEKIFLSWYTDFSGVTVISAEQMASVMLGGNVTYKPGTRMIKIESDPKVYVVSRGGLLRWVPTEEIATHLYGATWNKRIDDVSVSFFPNYHYGSQIAPTESL